MRSRHPATVPARGPAEPLLTALRACLDGDGPALLPVPDGEPARALVDAARLDEPVDDGTALLLPTSGSTGVPKVVELPATALVTSARATHEVLAGPGTWLLALPLTHVAGWQVLVRSAVAGTHPVALDPSGPFSPEAFVGAAAQMPASGPAYTALVPTQLHRILSDDAATSALQRFSGVLVGGAACPEPLLARALDAGVAVRTTYGMTETSGGCCYDGRPLPGVAQVALEAGGRVRVGGPVLALRYRDDAELTATSFVVDDRGDRWFRTGDRGVVSDGLLRVEGRIDDVIVTGGVNVHPAAVERVISGLEGVRGAIVVGLPDAEWGQVVVALVDANTAVPASTVRALVAEQLGRESAPRHVVQVESLPLRGIGKPDRAAAARIAAERLA